MARQQQPQLNMGFKRLWIRLHCPPVKLRGIVQAILRVGHVARVKQRPRVSRMDRKPGFERGFCRLPVGFDARSLGPRNLFGDGLGRCGGCLLFLILREILAEAGNRDRGEQKCEKSETNHEMPPLSVYRALGRWVGARGVAG